jgi:hypothetical protein
MSEPHPELAGDYRDDDGIAIDQMFEAGYTGPEQTDMLVAEKESIKPVTRLITAVTSVVQNAAPVMILPADPNRVDLILVTDQTIHLSSEANLATFAASLPATFQWQSVNHTGALWAHTTGTTATVQVWSVTC